MQKMRVATLNLQYSQWPYNAQEHIVWMNVNLTNTQFLSAPPNETGTVPNDKFRKIIKTYLGLPTVRCGSFVGQWIGTANHQHRVDEHDSSVSAHNTLQGAGYNEAHNDV